MGRPRIEHQLVDGTVSKRCCTCKQWLALDQFSRNASRRDGLNSACRPCSSSATAKSRAVNIDAYRQYDREYAKANRTKKTAARRAWREANKDRDEATRQRYLERNADRLPAMVQKTIAARDPAKTKAAQRRYYESDRQKRIDQVRQWRLDNPEAAALKGVRDRAKRRARERALASDGWTEQQVIERDGFTCWINGCSVGGKLPSGRRDWAIDHLIPIAVEYRNHPGDTLANVAVACHPCNVWKHNKLLPAAIARYLSNVEAAAA